MSIGRKEPEKERKSKDRKFEQFGFTPINQILSYKVTLNHKDTPGVHLIYLNRNQDSKSRVRFTVLFELIGNMTSNRVDHTQFIILSESIIQDCRDGVLHRFI